MNSTAIYQDDHTIIEKINGQEVLMSPRPATRHSRAAGRIYGIFFHFLSMKFILTTKMFLSLTC